MLSGSLMNILAAVGRGCTPPSTPQLSTQLMDQSPCFSSAQLYITLRVSSWRRDTNCEGRLFTQAFITQGLQGWTGNTGADWANWTLLHRLRVDSPVSHSIAHYLFFFFFLMLLLLKHFQNVCQRPGCYLFNCVL